MRNDGAARFSVAGKVEFTAQTFSISSVDYDLDGDLDLYVCGYNATAEELGESGVLGMPMPFHDAENGGGNTLLENTGDFAFNTVN